MFVVSVTALGCRAVRIANVLCDPACGSSVPSRRFGPLNGPTMERISTSVVRPTRSQRYLRCTCYGENGDANRHNTNSS